MTVRDAGADGSPERRLKVAALVRRIGPSGGGGAERVARDLLVMLDPERFERILFFSRAPLAGDDTGEPIAAELRRQGVRVEFLRRRFKYDPLAWWPMMRLLRRERVDVLHSHAFGPNAWAAVLGRMVGVPVVVAHEHNWAFEGRAMRPIVDRRVIAPATDAIIVVSGEARRRMIELERIAPDDLVLLPNGIRALPPGDGQAVRAELGIGPDDPVVGAVSVFRPEKALHLLIRAAAPLARELPRLRVVLAGMGPDRERLEAVVREEGLEDRVLFVGMRTDVPDVLAALDVAVLCSEFEGIPLALLEYMDAARPIVATRVGGIPELITDGTHGLLVESGDVQALAGAVKQLLTDPGTAARLGAHARERRRAEFSLEGTVERLEGLYEHLHAERRRGRAGSR